MAEIKFPTYERQETILINSNVAVSRIDEVDNNVLSTISKINNLETTLSNVNTNTAKGFIKSVQRGSIINQSLIIDNLNILRYTNIPLSIVNPSKCIILLDFKNLVETTTDLYATIYQFTPNLLQLTEGSNHWGSDQFEILWQVIEFY